MNTGGQVRIEKAVYGGDGLARLAGGKTVFVPLTLPGELVDVRVGAEKRGYAQAEATAIVETAPERVAARCRHYGVCGGCSYQHAEYAAQVAMKRSILRDTLERAGVSAPEIALHAGPEWEYRNRVRMHFLRHGCGTEQSEAKLRLGYKQRRTNTVFALEECPIAAQLLVRAAERLCATMQDATWADAALEAEFSCDESESALQIAIRVKASTKVSAAELGMMMERMELKELRGAGVFEETVEGEAPREIAKWGAEAMQYAVGGREYRVSRGAFFQGNRFLTGKLVKLATEGRSGALAWDLYAGVGLFSVALAEQFERVVAVEVAAAAIGDLQHNLAKAGKQHRAIAQTTLEFLERTASPSSRRPPEVIVMDPPRAGVGAAACKLLAQVGAKELVYVSCDPVTLSRDVAGLIESGYKLHALHLVDLFPQTFHMETVAVLKLS